MDIVRSMRQAVVSAAAVLAFLPVSCGQKDAIDAKVDDLLSKMTLQEKIGQMNQVSVAGLSPEIEAGVRDGSIGSILNEVNPEVINEYQRIAVEESRLGIPLLVARDVIHGFRTVFPIPLGMAATFDTDLVQKGARLTAEEVTASGVRWTFSPMLDVARDPRWGRIAEGSGEDTYLNAVMGAAMVRGYQGDCSDSTSLAACAKHFVGYGAVEGGRDYNSTYIPPRQMMNVYLPPFEAAVKAGAMTLMTSFNDNDGIPSTGNKELLKGVLRDQWGFDGLVVTDWASAAEMIQHGFAADGKHAAELSLNAGVDMDMMSYVYTAHLEELLSEGKVRMEDIDNAVRNILRVKFRLGLFEHPYVDVAAAQNVQYNDSIMEAAYQTALESAVLLENDGVLPLDMTKVRRVLVTGPMADAPYDQMGTWTFDGQKEHTVTPLDAIREKYGKDVEIIYEPGLTYCREFNSKGIAKAVAAARRADVILAFMGEEAIMSGEAHCLADITLKGDQRKMLEALASTGKPLVLSVMAGRPLVLDKEASMCDAILYSFHPGTMGGPAIVDLLTGEAVPSGKTPVSFPAASGQVPCYYSHNNTGRPFRGTETMLYDIPLNAGQTSLGNTSYLLDAGFYPQYPFGYGLSYTEFRYSAPVFSTSGAAAAQGSAADSLQHVYSVSDTIHVEAMLSNTGKMQGTEVAQLYVRDLVGSVTRPVKELKAFRRVTLAPGESVKVAFDLPVSDLAFYGLDMKKKVEPGDFQLWIAGDSASGTPAEFTVR